MTSKLSYGKSMIAWQNFLKKIVTDFKDKTYIFIYKAEMNILTTANKLDRSYHFFIKHNMHAVEWILNAMINKNQKLINNLNRNWRHPSIRKFEKVPM